MLIGTIIISMLSISAIATPSYKSTNKSIGRYFESKNKLHQGSLDKAGDRSRWVFTYLDHRGRVMYQSNVCCKARGNDVPEIIVSDDGSLVAIIGAIPEKECGKTTPGYPTGVMFFNDVGFHSYVPRRVSNMSISSGGVYAVWQEGDSIYLLKVSTKNPKPLKIIKPEGSPVSVDNGGKITWGKSQGK